MFSQYVMLSQKAQEARPQQTQRAVRRRRPRWRRTWPQGPPAGCQAHSPDKARAPPVVLIARQVLRACFSDQNGRLEFLRPGGCPSRCPAALTVPGAARRSRGRGSAERGQASVSRSPPAAAPAGSHWQRLARRVARGIQPAAHSGRRAPWPPPPPCTRVGALHWPPPHPGTPSHARPAGARRGHVCQRQ